MERANHTERRFWFALALFAIAVGAGWRLVQYQHAASLFVDEAAVARNVLDRNVPQLLGRLDFGQIAPAGFLLAVKASAEVFGPSERSLRLVPLIFGLAALPLFWLVVRRALDAAAAAVAVALVAMAPPLLVWSDMLKQYSSDVFSALAVIALTQWAMSAELPRRDVAMVALGGVAAVLLSQAALFVLGACALALIVEPILEKRLPSASRLFIVASWGVAALSQVLWSRHLMLPVDYAYMRRFWASQMMPAEWGVAGRWLSQSFLRMFADTPWPDGGLMYQRPKLYLLLAGAGALALVIQRRREAWFFIGPPVFVTVAAMAKQYPLGGRSGLFLLPLLLTLVVAGAQAIGSVAGRWGRTCLPLALLPLASSLFVAMPVPFAPEDARPTLEYLSSQVQRDDAIWVHYGAGQVFAYYARLIPFDADVSFGTCDRVDGRASLYQVDALRNRHRAWVVMGHTPGADRQALLGYLDVIGARRDAYPPDASDLDASVYLYELNDATRLASATAAQFSVPDILDPDTGVASVRCRRRWAASGRRSRNWNGGVAERLPRNVESSFVASLRMAASADRLGPLNQRLKTYDRSLHSRQPGEVTMSRHYKPGQGDDLDFVLPVPDTSVSPDAAARISEANDDPGEVIEGEESEEGDDRPGAA